MIMQTEHTNTPPKHVNAKGSVGGRKRSGYHEMMMQTEHTNIPPKHVNAKVQSEEEREVDIIMIEHTNIPSKHVNQLEEEREVDIM